MSKSDEKTRTTESYSNLVDSLKRKIEEILADDNIISQINQTLKSLQEKNDSQETFMFKTGLLIRYLFSCLIDADRINTADFEIPQQAKERNLCVDPCWDVLIKKLDRRLSEFSCQNHVDFIRGEVSDECLRFAKKPKGLYQLTVPTGGGKTLSSLRFALNHAWEHGMDRIIYILPYTSIIDKMPIRSEDSRRENGRENYAIILSWTSLKLDRKKKPAAKSCWQKIGTPGDFHHYGSVLKLFSARTRNAENAPTGRAVLILTRYKPCPLNVSIYLISLFVF